ncbi:hypothetical protein ACNKHM_04290 [Shigella sonnei]
MATRAVLLREDMRLKNPVGAQLSALEGTSIARKECKENGCVGGMDLSELFSFLICSARRLCALAELAKNAHINTMLHGKKQIPTININLSTKRWLWWREWK